MENETEYLTFMRDLLQHTTRVLYEQARADLLKLISRKISYKERLLTEFDTEFTDALQKRLMSAETEVSALISFVKAFDNMAELLTDNAVNAAVHAYDLNRQNAVLNRLLDANTERAESWSNAAFKLATDYEITLRNRTQCLKQN